MLRPRHYARDICALASREARVDALARVPDDLREMVATHVRITFAINKSKRERHEQTKREVSNREPHGTGSLF
jgi:hypothetical protein